MEVVGGVFSTDSLLAPGALWTLTSDFNLEGLRVGAQLLIKGASFSCIFMSALSYCSHSRLQNWLKYKHEGGSISVLAC